MSCKRHALSHYGITCAKPQHAYHYYIHACICLKHYDLLFKYMNPLSYQIMIFVSLLHPHNPLTFVATTNFLSCMHTPSSPSPSLSILSIAHIHFFFFFRSFSHSLHNSFPTQTNRQTSPAMSSYNIHTHLQSPPLCVLASCLSYGQTHV